MGDHTSRPKYGNNCVLSNAHGVCHMRVAAMDRGHAWFDAGPGKGATGRHSCVQRTLTKVSNRHVVAFPPFAGWPVCLDLCRLAGVFGFGQ
jgi:hypothetical protein